MGTYSPCPPSSRSLQVREQRVSSQLQSGLSIGMAAVSRGSPCTCALSRRTSGSRRSPSCGSGNREGQSQSFRTFVQNR